MIVSAVVMILVVMGTVGVMHVVVASSIVVNGECINDAHFYDRNRFTFLPDDASDDSSTSTAPWLKYSVDSDDTGIGVG